MIPEGGEGMTYSRLLSPKPLSCVFATFEELQGRCLEIVRKHAKSWGIDPMSWALSIRLSSMGNLTQLGAENQVQSL